MSSSRPIVANRFARRLFLNRHGLGRGNSGPGSGADLLAVIDALGFVQLDSVNTVARAHHMILHARRKQYRPRYLDQLFADRQLFEHWTHDAAAIPMRLYPHWRLKRERDAARLRSRWSAWRRDDWPEKLEAVLEQVARDGLCGSGDVGKDEARTKSGWWDWHPSKTALEYLWRSGALEVSRRANFRKLYDLSENVIPAALRTHHIADAAIIDTLCAAALDRLGFATSGEIAAFWDIVTPQEAKAWCVAQLETGALIEAEIEGAAQITRRAYLRPQSLQVEPPPLPGRARILSPFDPALRDRKRTERLFGFHYRIEIFTPAKKRKYGYYVFPVLEADQLIGRIDMIRNNGVLRVTAYWPEPRHPLSPARETRLTRAIEATARLAEVSGIEYAPDWRRD